MKIKEFKAIAIEVSRFLKKYWFYKQNRERYLSMQNISAEQSNTIKSEMLVEFNLDGFPENIKEEDKDIEESKKIFLNAITVESFYRNHELFKLLSKERDEDSLYFKFFEIIFSKNHNENVKNFNATELNKSLIWINKEKYNLVVLQKALNEVNLELFNIIKPYLSWTQDNVEIERIILKAILENGKKIKNSLIEKEIKQIFSIEQIFKKEVWDKNTTLTENREKNINSFFDINITQLIAKTDIKYIDLEQISHKKAQQILNNVDIDKNYSKKYMEYIVAQYAKVSLKSKFNYLKNKNVLTDEFWNESLKVENGKFIKIIFLNQEEVKPFILEDKFSAIVEQYKKNILNSNNSDNRVVQFVKLYPGELDKETILKLMQVEYKHSYTSNFEMEARNLINEKYTDQIVLDEVFFLESNKYMKDSLKNTSDLLNTLYEKYPHIMNNEEFFKESLKNLQNDNLMSLYIRKFCEDNPGEEIKKEIVKSLDILTSHYQSSNILLWIIENNLLNEIIPKTMMGDTSKGFLGSNSYLNKWMPLLIEIHGVSPDTLIYQTVTSFTSNNELFKFILNNYELKPRTEQEICNRVFAINEVDLATEMFKKGIVPNDYYAEKFASSQTEAGHILLKSKLKNKLENLDSLENKVKTIKVRKI